MPGPDDKDELLKTPSANGHTTPLGSSDSSATAERGRSPSPLPAVSARYEILGELGRGGMGVVYRARDRETGDLVALKALRAEIAGNAAILERFKNELLLARKITHKNICRTYELLRFDDTVVIAMEHVEGRSLRSYLEAGAGVAVSRGLDWARQICDGLREAHAQGVVHRDLKPENILVDRRGQVKVMDFGIARSLEPDATQTGSVIGTPAYMAPEQAEGKPVDQRTDVYALGLIFYEMFTGRQPFTAETPLALVHKQVHDTPPPAHAVEPFLPDFVNGAIEKCLEKDPGRRFQSVEELEAALQGQAGARPVAGDIAEVELPERLTRWQRSDWGLLAAGIAGVVLFLHFFPLTNLASRPKVTFDRSVLQRTAEDYARRLNTPGRTGRIGFVVGPERYVFLAERAGSRVALEAMNNPVPYWYWWVEWQKPDGSEASLTIDNNGTLVAFDRDLPSKGIPPASLEEAKPWAEKALREFLGCDPTDMRLASAGNILRAGSPANQFRWESPREIQGLKERCDITLVGTEVGEMSRRYYVTAEASWFRRPAEWIVNSIAVTFVLVLILGLSQIRRVNVFVRWRVIVGLLSMGLGGSFISFVENPPMLGLVALGTVFALGGFFCSIALERAFSNRAPAQLGTLARLLDKRATSAPCGLAVLRGTLVGVALLGAETAIFWLGMGRLGMRGDIHYHVETQVRLLNTLWPGGQDVIYALFQGGVTAFIISLVASLALRLTRRHLIVAVLCAALVAASDIHWSLGRVQPNHWMVALLFVEYLILVWALLRYDVLTLCTAVFTAAFCLENYSLLSMLSPTGAPGEWLAFGIWGLVVVLAALVAWQASLRSAYRRVAAAFG